jgi:hypothetical protein
MHRLMSPVDIDQQALALATIDRRFAKARSMR